MRSVKEADPLDAGGLEPGDGEGLALDADHLVPMLPERIGNVKPEPLPGKRESSR